MWIPSTQISSFCSCKVFSRYYSTVLILLLFFFGASVLISFITIIYNHQQHLVTISSRQSANDVARRQPILIVSEGRSGSSFTLQLIGSLPLSLTHFEPLLLLPDNSTTAPEDIIQDFLNCRFGSVFHEILLKRNNPTYVWNICWNNNNEASINNDICYNQTALQDICKLFPVQVIKVIRLPLSGAEKLLYRMSDLKVIYLVRDPRATLHSRKQLGWTTTSEALCAKLARDYNQAVRLQRQYSDRFTILRYEDLAATPIVTARQLFKWLRLPWLPQVGAFIADHSAKDSDGSFTTFRRKGSRIASWINDSTWNDVQHMQQVCDTVLNSYGYLKIKNRWFGSGKGSGYKQTVARNNNIFNNYLAT